MIVFQNIHLIKDLKQSNGFKEFFRMCIYDFIQSFHLRKFLKQAKSFKEFFKNAFKMILQKHLHSGKVSNNIKEKFLFFGIKESLKIASKAVSSWRTSIKKFINQGNQKSFDILALTIDNK